MKQLTQKVHRWHFIQGAVFICAALIVCTITTNAMAASPTKQTAPKAAPAGTYYGADLGKMLTATGVDSNNPSTIASNKPWPQNAGNYCFLASIQAVVNYNALLHNAAIRYPSHNNQGPASGNPSNETSGQILYDLDHYVVPSGGPLKVNGSGTNRRPFTLANIAYDFGGDPRAIAAGIDYEIGKSGYSDGQYHQHIYHNGTAAATEQIGKYLAQYNKPIVALVNHAEHAVVVAGVWATTNPATDSNAQITALAVYNPWNQSWGTYMTTGYYAQVTYSAWTTATNLPSAWGGTNSWFSIPYQSNNGADPDPSMGIYQAGPNTANPTATHWINNFVSVQFDGHATSADTAYDETDTAMTRP